MSVAISTFFFLFCYDIAGCCFYGFAISSQVLHVIVRSVYFDNFNLNGRICHLSGLNICIFIHGNRYRHGFYISIWSCELFHDIQGMRQSF